MPRKRAGRSWPSPDRPSIREPSCNQLIRQGATLVQNAADVLEAVRPIQPRFASPRATYEPAEPRWVDGDAGALGLVEELLGPAPVPVDEIIRLSVLRVARCRWPSLSWTSPATSTDMRVERSVFDPLDEPNPSTPRYTRMREGKF